MKIDRIGSVDITAGIERKQVTEEQKFEQYLRKAYSDGDKQQLKNACKEFEVLFMQMMYKQMKRTVPKAASCPKAREDGYLKKCLMKSL